MEFKKVKEFSAYILKNEGLEILFGLRFLSTDYGKKLINKHGREKLKYISTYYWDNISRLDGKQFVKHFFKYKDFIDKNFSKVFGKECRKNIELKIGIIEKELRHLFDRYFEKEEGGKYEYSDFILLLKELVAITTEKAFLFETIHKGASHEEEMWRQIRRYYKLKEKALNNEKRLKEIPVIKKEK